MFRKRLLIVALVLAALALFAPAALAQGESPNPADLSAVLRWIVEGPGVPVILAALASFLAENVAVWHSLDSRLKTIFFLALSMLLPWLAQTVMRQEGFIADLAPTWALLMNGVIAWLASQVTYSYQKRTVALAASKYQWGDLVETGVIDPPFLALRDLGALRDAYVYGLKIDDDYVTNVLMGRGEWTIEAVRDLLAQWKSAKSEVLVGTG